MEHSNEGEGHRLGRVAMRRSSFSISYSFAAHELRPETDGLPFHGHGCC